MYEETNQRLNEKVFLYEAKLGLTSPHLHLTSHNVFVTLNGLDTLWCKLIYESGGCNDSFSEHANLRLIFIIK